MIVSLLFVAGVKAQQAKEPSFFYRSELSKWTREIPADTSGDIEKGILLGKYAANGMRLVDLYNVAYFGKISWNETDTSLYGRVYRWPILRLTNPEPFNSDFNTEKGYYNYSLEVPKEKLNMAYMQFAMQCDLKKYFGYKVEEERLDMPCWIMTTTPDEANNLRSKASTSTIRSDLSGFSCRKVKMGKVLEQILKYRENEDPIFNMTNMPYDIDLEIKADMTNMEQLRKALAQHGILLMKVKKLMTVMVISDPESNIPEI